MIQRYELCRKLGEGSYGIVYKALDKYTGDTVALKVLKFDHIEKDGIPSNLLREISILKSLNHINLISLKDVRTSTVPLYLAFEYIDFDLAKLLDRSAYISPNLLRSYAFQMLAGIYYLHSHRIIHRDIKPENMLITKKGVLKICDFGMARYFAVPMRPYTKGVVTLWYKAPELIIGGFYELSIDIWSVGCILFEMITNVPLFPGEGQMDQINKIFSTLGTPSEDEYPGVRDKLKQKFNMDIPDYKGCDLAEMMSGADDLLIDLVMRMLRFDPMKRISAKEALNHPYFNDIMPEMRKICLGTESKI